jgi:hypothetical protein
VNRERLYFGFVLLLRRYDVARMGTVFCPGNKIRNKTRIFTLNPPEHKEGRDVSPVFHAPGQAGKTGGNFGI